MNNSIYDIFLDLEGNNTAEDDKFSAKPLPFNPNHKIGIDSNGYPLFFVECIDFEVVPNIDLELISVQFNQLCRLTNKEKTSEGRYTIISLKTINPDFLRYFIDVTSLILQRMNKRPSHKEVTSELSKLIELFKVFSKPSRKTIQGLWAELFVIEQAKDPVYMLQSWHVSPEDKYDFNDGNDKVEVKCTVNSQRKHRFSYEQLTPNTKSQILIASVITTRSGKGKNVFDLKDSILRKVQDLKLHLILNEVIASTLGTDFDKAFEYYFDYQMAIDGLSFFDVNEIPNIPSDVIPIELSNIKFDCDLTRIKVASKETNPVLNTILFNSIGL
ncbi:MULTISPECIES: PD-(D/E)XK motif protein [Bacteroidaceae]|mgnify:FL=1|jgi:hypothetical protein|uniref:PD-(D/E)XK motif protein n=1 Tax=Bacteroidaceae TaxID=815 RepID=UPI0024330995|nr:PD-(D/E)XK motif protein [Bacteroides acidifaciens]